MNTKGKLGRIGEDEVCGYLIGKGHTILDRNWRYGHLEIDIISLSNDGIHFVEVKSRAALSCGMPEDAVNSRKQKHIAKAAGRWLSLKGKKIGNDLEVWFDVAAVTFHKGQTEIRYIPGAYTPIFC